MKIIAGLGIVLVTATTAAAAGFAAGVLVKSASDSLALAEADNARHLQNEKIWDAYIASEQAKNA